MDIAKAVFFCVSTLLLLTTVFGAGMYSAATRNDAYMAFENGVKRLDVALNAVGETPLVRPTPFLQPARGPGAGVTVNRRPDDGALVLLSGFFEDDNELRLVRRDGTAVARWPVRYSELFPDPDHLEEPPATDWNIDTHGALALPDGSVVFNFEYAGLVRLDRCGGVAWTLEHPTHHSVERAARGGFWVPGRRMITSGDSRLAPFPAPIKEDLILHVSGDGRITRTLSVPRLLHDNGLEAIHTAIGSRFDRPLNDELLHLNKIEELGAAQAAAFPGLDAGDLALSLRNYNLLVVVDPDTRRVKWHRTGPWIRQHDPEFTDDGTIVLFNNNHYATGRSRDEMPREGSNILRFDLSADEAAVLFGDRPGQELSSVIRGKVDPLEGGGLLITEFEGGRVIETDADGRIVWEYVNRYDDANVAEISEARLYPPGYFRVDDWSCDGPGS